MSATTSDTTMPETVQRRRDSRPSPSGYQLSGVLGRGGMGEVMLAHDPRIGRDVAIKLLHDDLPDDETLARFLREAKIQARLEHPAIVPVHEIGRDEDGRPYFTMKRIAGRTLKELLDDPQTSRQRLLRALVDVCLAIDYAHARAVVHRDLKPANVMLGDFGEVYVIDWGLAQVVGEAARESDVAGMESSAILGTPGYAAPEQIRGEDVGLAADIYALGSILYEILTRCPLHPRGRDVALDSTLATPARDPKTILELDALCVAALAREPESRPSARTLATTLESYLDGDRDIARRRVLAAEQLAIARAALAGGSGRRADAIRAAGRALGLDPESEAAALLVGSLVCETPHEIPASLAGLAERRRDRAGGARLANRRARALRVLPVHPGRVVGRRQGSARGVRDVRLRRAAGSVQPVDQFERTRAVDRVVRRQHRARAVARTDVRSARGRAGDRRDDQRAVCGAHVRDGRSGRGCSSRSRSCRSCCRSCSRRPACSRRPGASPTARS